MMSSLNLEALGYIQNSIRTLQRQAASLLLFQSILKTPMAIAFFDLLQSFFNSDDKNFTSLTAYGRFFQLQAELNLTWQQFLIEEILLSDNAFSRQVQQQSLDDLPASLIEATQHDLQILQSFYECTNAVLSQWLKASLSLVSYPVVWDTPTLADFAKDEQDEESFTGQLRDFEHWGEAIELFAEHYQQFGCGIWAKYRAFQWIKGDLKGISHPDPIRLNELASYQWQTEALIKNTQFLLADLPALHVLLYGSRGTGKSSLIKALVNEYYQQNLRLIEVNKSDLHDLPVIMEMLRDQAQKFIIFVDDLSFEEDDDTFKSLKVVLEGGLTARSNNVVVYATSNRRHLVREYFADRPRPQDGDEIQAWDTLQEKLSFSDRFGLTLTFEPADQDTYLEIVNHLAKQKNLKIKGEKLAAQAKEWATRHNGRSGRTARQFIDFLYAETHFPKNQ